MADDKVVVNRRDREEQIDTLSTNEGNVSELPENGESDVSIWIVLSVLVCSVLLFIFFFSTLAF